MESCFVPVGPINIQFLVYNCYAFSTWILRILKRSSIHRLQLGFVIVFIAPIGFSCFNTLNDIHFRISVRDVVVLKCCLEWASNESDFCPFLSRANICVKYNLPKTGKSSFIEEGIVKVGMYGHTCYNFVLVNRLWSYKLSGYS